MITGKFRVLLLLLVPIIFFSKAFFGDYIIAVGDFTGSDLLDLHYPFRYNLRESFLEGSFPIWELNLAMGFPQFAEGQTGVLYPVNILLSFVNAERALNLSVILAVVVALYSSYYYFRLMQKSRLASSFGAIAFSFSSFFVTRLKHINLINVASLFPLLLITTHLYFQKREIKYAVFTGIVLAAMVFAGHPQITFYSILVYVFYSIFESFKKASRESINANGLHLLKYLIISISLGMALSAVQIVPTLEFASYSSRLNTNSALIQDCSFHPRNLITLVSPFHFGNPAGSTYKEDIRSIGVFWENATYLGIGPLILAVYWIIRWVKRRKYKRYTGFFSALALVSLLIMLGYRTPLIFILAKAIPFFSLFRFPARFNLFLLFSLAFLAVCAFDYFQKVLRGNYKRIFIFIFLASVLADLYIFANSYIGYLPLDEFRKEPKIIKTLREDEALFRIYNLTQYEKSPYLEYGWINNSKPLLKIREAIPPNNNLLYDIDSFTERGWFEGGLSIERRNNLETAILLGVLKNPEIVADVLGMFNIKYLISFQEIPGTGIVKIREWVLGDEFQDTLKLFENKKVLPRAYFVADAIEINRKDEFFNIISNPSFNSEESVVIERSADNRKPYDLRESASVSENGISIKKYSDTEVIIQADVRESGYLVLSDIQYPGWEAQVGGEKSEILTANYVARALKLDPGKYQVRFFYNPMSFKVGAIISLASLNIVSIFGIGNLIKRRKI